MHKQRDDRCGPRRMIGGGGSQRIITGTRLAAEQIDHGQRADAHPGLAEEVPARKRVAAVEMCLH